MIVNIVCMFVVVSGLGFFSQCVLCFVIVLFSCIARSIPHGGPNQLFLLPASARRLVKQKLWYVISYWDGAYKRTLAANRKELPM